MNWKGWVLIAVVLGVVLLIYTQLTVFLVQPIGALPEGKTLIVLRGGGMKFIDSADAVCERTMGGVSLLCRAMVLGTVAEHSTILLRLPYSEMLYLISTSGKTYER